MSRWGDEQSAAKINNQKLYQYSQRLLAESRLELFYCGSAERRRVEDALLEAFAALPRGVPAELSAPERPGGPVRAALRDRDDGRDAGQARHGLSAA